jgi:hypothetical protein
VARGRAKARPYICLAAALKPEYKRRTYVEPKGPTPSATKTTAGWVYQQDPSRTAAGSAEFAAPSAADGALEPAARLASSSSG